VPHVTKGIGHRAPRYYKGEVCANGNITRPSTPRRNNPAVKVYLSEHRVPDARRYENIWAIVGHIPTQSGLRYSQSRRKGKRGRSVRIQEDARHDSSEGFPFPNVLKLRCRPLTTFLLTGIMMFNSGRLGPKVDFLYQTRSRTLIFPPRPEDYFHYCPLDTFNFQRNYYI
jgi:hypothetical protein